ncbi:MAG: AI-2E family transporter [Pseudomonadota bacterium]|nr:AI-2E family transporter [Pseudomonadota bacterium]
MKQLTGLSLAKGNLFSFGSRFQLLRIVLIISILALTTLFLPFAKSATLAIIFSFAVIGVKDRIAQLSKQKQLLLYGSLGVASLAFISLSMSTIKMMLSAMSSVSDPTSLAKIKIKISELFLPMLRILKEQITKVWHQFDNTGTIESKLSESASTIFDSIFAFGLQGLTRVPSNAIQIFFFFFLFVFLIHKIKTIEHFGFAFFSPKNNATLSFLISTAKRSAYQSVTTTIVTALAQASILTIGSIVIGIAGWPIVFIFSFFSAMIPIVGVLPITIACTVYALSEFGTQRAIIVGIFGLSASIIDNFLRPILISNNKTNLNPFLSFFALIGSLFIFGFAGLFIGPFILVFTATLFKKIH